MNNDTEQITKFLKDDSQSAADLEVLLSFDRNSGISITFPSIKQDNEENPISEIFLDFFDARVSFTIYRENDENPQIIYLARNEQDHPNKSDDSNNKGEKP